MHSELAQNLSDSGLAPQDLNAKQADASVLAACGVPTTVPGFVIPYYDMWGNPIPHYRVRLYQFEPKYKQPKGTRNHIYFPPQFKNTFAKVAQQEHPYVVVTEGEKKAVMCCKAGMPAVALGGVDSWRNKTILLPDETEFDTTTGKSKLIKAKLPDTNQDFPEISTLAEGMRSLIDVCLQYNITMVIVYDTDESSGVKPQVQRAAAQLGYSLRFEGMEITKVRQLVLPQVNGNEKTGLDDFIMHEGSKALGDLITNCLNEHVAFPRHPNPKEHINKQLQRQRLNRKEAQNLSMTVLAELDARGRRMMSESTGDPYYFDEVSRRLMPAQLLHKSGEPLHETTFGTFLYRNFNLSAADSKILTWLATQYTGEDPIEKVQPRRVRAQPPQRQDSIAIQISDSQFAIVTPDEEEPLVIRSNGTENLLFEQDQVNGIDGEELQKAFDQQNSQETIDPWWHRVIKDLNMQGENPDNSRQLATFLFYISPWLYRWRGAQLPIEIIVGEAGSGKSSLMNLRLNILTGRPYLRNMPTDLRDWYTSVLSTGGMHVIDNVHFTNKDLKQRLSDEMCRITTEPHPMIEMRRLYTTNSQMQVPVRVTFGMTAIQQPFHNADLLQRASVFELAALTNPHDGDWVTHQLNRFGGRTQWLAHQLVVLHRFLKAVVYEGYWNPEYQATNRLTHYEQIMTIMAEVLGFDSSWIPDALAQRQKESVSEADWAMEALKEFARQWYTSQGSRVFSVNEIVDWALSNEDHAKNPQFNSARRLSKYIASHAQMIKNATGIEDAGHKDNRKVFRVGTDPEKL